MIPHEMATPRRDIIDPNKPCVCHCVSRCVRRLFLLDDRPLPNAPTGTAEGDELQPSREPGFWKRLLSDRIVQIVAIFAIDVIDFAILSNHIHLLLSTHPDLVAAWSDEEVATRWRTLTPDYHWRRRNKVAYDLPAQHHEVVAMLRDKKAIAHARRVLADVSQFHKFLKQRIAQLGNALDKVSGHFWDGRFKSIVATDTESIVAHMVYIALNQVRAGLATSLEECAFASIRGRIDELKRRIDAGEFAGEVETATEKLRGLKLLPALPCNPGEAVKEMPTLSGRKSNPWRNGQVPPVVEGLTVAAFLNEVDCVGRIEREGKASLSPDRPTVMTSLELRLSTRLDRSFAATRSGIGVSGKDENTKDGPAATRTPSRRGCCTPETTGVALGARAKRRPSISTVANDVMQTAAAYASAIDEALSRGSRNAFGNFSGGLRSVALRAAELHRSGVWTIFDPVNLGPARWVGAASAESEDDAATLIIAG